MTFFFKGVSINSILSFGFEISDARHRIPNWAVRTLAEWACDLMACGKERQVTYYISDGQTRQGPFPSDQLIARGLTPDMLVWCEGMAEWQPARAVPALRFLFGAHAAPAQQYTPRPFPPGPDYAGDVAYDAALANSKRITAGVLGIVLGAFGVHKFALGMTGAGLTMLLATVCSCGILWIVMHIIGLIEGIIYLAKSDEEFYRTYIVNRQPWF